MIQFNLLPDIKIEYLKARRQKHMVMLGSIVAIIASLIILAILIAIVFGLQKKNISDLNTDITQASKELQDTEDLTKILTVQNQLLSITPLHDQKAAANRLFGYITQVTPSSASISRLNVDFAKNTISISGSADTLNTVNTFTDTLKFATYHTAKDVETEKPAFSDVVLSNFGRDSKGATYTITTQFDLNIFNIQEDVTLTVPKKVTTRSEVQQPAALFQKAEQ
jgi:Tfp pilus assembly protein PilN